MKTTTASIEQIIEDLRDRAGLGDEWDGMSLTSKKKSKRSGSKS
jgi:hypothetical protein